MPLPIDSPSFAAASDSSVPALALTPELSPLDAFARFLANADPEFFAPQTPPAASAPEFSAPLAPAPSASSATSPTAAPALAPTAAHALASATLSEPLEPPEVSPAAPSPLVELPFVSTRPLRLARAPLPPLAPALCAPPAPESAEATPDAPRVCPREEPDMSSPDQAPHRNATTQPEDAALPPPIEASLPVPLPLAPPVAPLIVNSPPVPPDSRMVPLPSASAAPAQIGSATLAAPVASFAPAALVAPVVVAAPKDSLARPNSDSPDQPNIRRQAPSFASPPPASPPVQPLLATRAAPTAQALPTAQTLSAPPAAPSPRDAAAAEIAPPALPVESASATPENAAPRAQAVFAGPHVEAASGRLTLPADFGKNMSENPPQEEPAKQVIPRGMEKAKLVAVMPSPAPQAPAFAASTHVVEPSAPTPAPFALSEPAAFSPTTSHSVPASEAARVIARVAEVAEQVAARPGEPVRLNIDLGGEHRVEVKVTLRGGRVFADFRADTVELQSALARGWDDFVRGREASGARWGEATFSRHENIAHPPAPVAASSGSSPGRDGDSASRRELGGDSHHDSSRRGAREEAAPAFIGATPVARAVSAATPAPLAAGPRPDPARRLSALA